MSSLSGQNGPRRGSSARSSRASSTIFFQLRKLDSDIHFIDYKIRYLKNWYPLVPSMIKERQNLVEKRQKLDQKRKEVRNKRKLHAVQK